MALLASVGLISEQPAKQAAAAASPTSQVDVESVARSRTMLTTSAGKVQVDLKRSRKLESTLARGEKRTNPFHVPSLSIKICPLSAL